MHTMDAVLDTFSNSSVYRGRFAPSPTGPLHFGSLVTAVGSYLDARSHNGEWRVRIEDLDPPREVPGAARDMLVLLEKLGMEWDGEVVYQSQRHDLYRAALAQLKKETLIYPCFCSRKEVAASKLTGIDGPIYPGTCRKARDNGQNNQQQKRSAMRVTTDNRRIKLVDRVQGFLSQRIGQDIGDFTLRRTDGVFAYQLAVVVDDADQHITHVVRGSDLLDSTPRQIFLQQLLKYPVPVYMHLPLATNRRGEKLSKQTFAAPVSQFDVLSQLVAALRFLGQNPPQALHDSNLETFWQWAVQHWRTDRIPISSAPVSFFIK
ncbi:glutamyl-Q tRNA(Asp) synthetase [Nitrosomonas sp. Nm51]|uniref:tRNA glutamyl-Q(34) synthetase GluQRS n=1 Tax=Nitrosomonas sp. Nm51 TaxID=133720 RepID=UPI0008D53C90|nr:tRNA glutamyl-Q(34) synthetase GluQRS [Nitrosomonas sp. Nm51]SER77808.1 glutamyl-Q tRNA(Asp) synthetase [Nitrosomonas sp. Nm51]